MTLRPQQFLIAGAATILALIFPLASMSQATAAARTAAGYHSTASQDSSGEESSIPAASPAQRDTALTAFAAVAEHEGVPIDDPSLTSPTDDPLTYTPTPLDARYEGILTPQLSAIETVDIDGKRVDIASDSGGTASIVSSGTGDYEREVIVIHDASAPTAFSFRLDLPVDAQGLGLSFQPNPDGLGGYQLVDPNANLAADIAAPWATTADGDPVPTTLNVEIDPVSGEEILVQNVDHSGLTASDYPIVADPKVTPTCGIITCTIYFSVQFSSHINHLIKYYGPPGAATIAAAMCTPLGGVGAAVCAAAVTFRFGDLSYYADQAASQGRCLAIKFNPASMAFWFQTNSISNRNCHAK